MLTEFQSNIRNNHLFSKEDRLLLAFSGGADSVVLADLLQASGYQFGLAHCNFKLRGQEAGEDEAFCRNAAKAMDTDFYSASFDTKTYADEHKLSVQMAARELRYNWFRELKQAQGYAYILTAHHADDQIETFFVNLSRGTGINGLRGIRPKQGDIIRPLLFAWKDEILSYAKQHKLPYRSDSSNAEVKYKRNFIRHEVIPKLKVLNPSFGETLQRNMQYFGEGASIIHDFSKMKFMELCRQQAGELHINAGRLTREPYKQTLLFSWLQPFGFNSPQAEQVLETMTKESIGKSFLSPTHRLLISRDVLIVSARQQADAPEEFLVNHVNDTAHLPIALHINFTDDQTIASSASIAFLDADLVHFPLTLRRWRHGDAFRPMGMQGFKKLSDYFTDAKMSLQEKEQAWVLESGRNIIWLVNHRIDDRFKLTEQTKHVIKISYL